MEYEIVITVLDERIAGIVKKNIEDKTKYHCDLRPARVRSTCDGFEIGDTVKLSYCDDNTIYTIDKVNVDQHCNMIYHLNGCQGWKAEVNLVQA